MRRVLYLPAAAVAAIALIFLIQMSATGAARVLEKRYPPPGVMVPVDGYRLQLYCSGAGSPTVVIEPGMGVDWVGWRMVISKLLETNRVCVYDRAGYGWSDPGPQPRTALREAGELDTLLSRAHVPQPYLLAAHSYGAYIARIFASQHRNAVAGVVLVDPSHEDEPVVDLEAAKHAHGLRIRDALDLLPPLGWQRLRRMYNGENALPPDLRAAPQFYRARYLVASSLDQLKLERNEFESLRLTNAQVRQTVFPRDLPLTVITATRDSERAGPGPTPRELHAQLARSSDFGKQIFATHSGHMVTVDEPDLVVTAVRDIHPAVTVR
jgi:pimeloyl-ACP methyl ester carboxylesterase